VPRHDAALSHDVALSQPGPGGGAGGGGGGDLGADDEQPAGGGLPKDALECCFCAATFATLCHHQPAGGGLPQHGASGRGLVPALGVRETHGTAAARGYCDASWRNTVAFDRSASLLTALRRFEPLDVAFDRSASLLTTLRRF
jgi:hypothetical protein